MLLKITHPEGNDGGHVMRLEGRLTAATVPELRAVCQAALARGRTALVDLAGVLFVDAAGTAALRDLEARGSVLIGCSAFVAEMLGTRAPSSPEDAAADPQADEEAELLANLRAGQPAAFERLVRHQAGPLLATARRILRHEDDARDAVQDAFTSAFRGIQRFAGDARLSTWLHRIVINAALMKLRARSRRPEEPIDDLLPRFDATGSWQSGMARVAGSAEARIESRQTREMVRRCIERLPETFRTVLVLRDLEDLDTTEVAVALGITPNAVKIRLHRAHQALRTLIEREMAASGSPRSRRPHQDRETAARDSAPRG